MTLSDALSEFWFYELALRFSLRMPALKQITEKVGAFLDRDVPNEIASLLAGECNLPLLLPPLPLQQCAQGPTDAHDTGSRGRRSPT